MSIEQVVEKNPEIGRGDCQPRRSRLLRRIVERVDNLLHRARRWQPETKNNLVEGLGSYVGEVLVREAGGRWCINEEQGNWMGTSLVLEFPGGPVGMIVSPLGRCWKRLEHGEADGVEVWARVVVAMNQQKEEVHAQE